MLRKNIHSHLWWTQPTGCVPRVTTIYRFPCISRPPLYNNQLVVSQEWLLTSLTFVFDSFFFFLPSFLFKKFLEMFSCQPTPHSCKEKGIIWSDIHKNIEVPYIEIVLISEMSSIRGSTVLVRDRTSVLCMEVVLISECPLSKVPLY